MSGGDLAEHWPSGPLPLFLWGVLCFGYAQPVTHAVTVQGLPYEFERSWVFHLCIYPDDKRARLCLIIRIIHVSLVGPRGVKKV
jgi:hypothetical protein